VKDAGRGLEKVAKWGSQAGHVGKGGYQEERTYGRRSQHGLIFLHDWLLYFVLYDSINT